RLLFQGLAQRPPEGFNFIIQMRVPPSWRADRAKRRGAVFAELCGWSILVLAPGTLHEHSPRAGRGSGPLTIAWRLGPVNSCAVYARDAVSLINLTIAHRQTQEEARRRLEMAVREVSERLGGISHVGGAGDHKPVQLP